MARIRTIKPDFFTDEKVGRLSYGARLLFIGILTQADDSGRFRASPALLRGLFPYDGETVNSVRKMLTELEQVSMIRAYEASGEVFGLVLNFAKHQRINRRSTWQLPPPPRELAAECATLTEGSLSAHGGLTVGKGKGKGKGKGTPSRDGDVSAEFITLWEMMPRKEGRKRAEGYYRALRAEHTPEDLLAAVQRYANHCRITTVDRQYIQQGSTLLNNLTDWLGECPRCQGPCRPEKKGPDRDSLGARMG